MQKVVAEQSEHEWINLIDFMRKFIRLIFISSFSRNVVQCSIDKRGNGKHYEWVIDFEITGSLIFLPDLPNFGRRYADHKKITFRRLDIWCNGAEKASYMTLSISI